jgi:type VI secretion system secreted protein VgrG
MSYTQLQRLFSFTTALDMDDLIVREFRGSEHVSKTYKFELSLISPNSAIGADELISRRAALSVQTVDGERYWTGVISLFQRVGEIRIEGEEDLFTEYYCEIEPLLAHLRHNEDARIFQQKTVRDIVEQVFEEFLITDYEFHLSGTYEPLEYCVQYQETTLEFVERILERAGIYYFFTHEAERELLILTDSRDSSPLLEQDRIEIRSAVQSDDAIDVITRLQRRQEIRSGRVTMRDFNFEKPKNLIEASIDTLIKAGDNTNYERYIYPGGFFERAGGENVSRLMMEAEEAEHESLDGESNVRHLVPGYRFTLEGHHDDALNVEHLVLGVDHEGRNNVGQLGESSYRNRFRSKPHQLQFRPISRRLRARMPGPQTAFVVGPPSEEVYTDKYGRVKVKFHWDRTPGNDEKTSCWLRVAQMWAGRQWGTFFLPRIGMEVVVDFLEGDPDQPLVTGCVYNADNLPPYLPNTHATVSTLKSHSSKGGGGFNELRFEDKKGHEQLFIHAQQRMDHVVRSSLYERVGGSREVRVGYDGKGDLNTFVHKDINQHLVGGQFELVDDKLNANIKKDVIEVYETLQTTVVENRLTQNAKEIVSEGQQLISLKAGQVVIQGAQLSSVKAGDVCLEGTTSVNIKCGGSFITLTPSGVFISGATVFINSGGSAKDAQSPPKAEDPTLETPFDADAATSALPGQALGGGAAGGGAARSRSSRTVPLRRAPEPPPPPPPHPRVVPGSGPHVVLDVEWTEAETWCSEPATLTGHTENYAPGETEAAQVRHVMDGTIVVGFNVAVSSDAFSQPVEVKNWLPRLVGGHYETERLEDGFVGGLKTPVPIRMRFIPNLTRTESSIGISQFALSVTDYMAAIEGSINYVKGWIQYLIQLGANVPAGTGGNAGVNFGTPTPGAFSGSDWRFAKASTTAASGFVFWDGSAWQPVPATWSDPTSTLLYPIGIWSEGGANKAQFGNNWPEAVPAWGAAQNTLATTTLATWVTNIDAMWTNKFDLKRKECLSTDPKCCRYKTRCSVNFTAVATRSGHTIVLAANNARSNAGAWSLGDTRPGMPPHEFGHHLGNPDEYTGGVGVDASVNTDGATAGIDSSSIMGSSMTTVKKRHYKTIVQHLAAMVSTQYGKTYTYEAVTVV